MMMFILFLLWIYFPNFEAGNIIPILRQYKSNITSRLGDNIRLKCPITADSKNSIEFYISWTVNGIDENMLSVDPRYQFKDFNTILEVSNLRKDDRGIYICKGVTGYGVKEAVFNVEIKDENLCRTTENTTTKTRFKPCFINSQMQNEISFQKIVRDIGSSVEFDCSAAGYPAPKYLWMKGKSSVDWIENITGIRQPILRINRVLLEYSGYFTCLVSNSMGEISYTYTLIVRDKHSKIPRIMNSLGNVTASLNSQAILVGSISCSCKPALQWLKRITNTVSTQKLIPISNAGVNERNELYSVLDPDNDITHIETIEKNNDVLVSILKIKSVHAKDAGKYVLMATNSNYGTSYGTVYLDVSDDLEQTKRNHPRLVFYIAIPIFILIICFGIIFYCWSRRHTPQRAQCPKRFCIGSSSGSSSSNIKSSRNTYPASATITSTTITTEKCSNGSSIFGKKSSTPSSDRFVQNMSNTFPLMPPTVVNRPFVPNENVSVISQNIAMSDPNFEMSFMPQGQSSKDINPYSYAKMPIQQVVFPHSNSRLSNSSQPNTVSGSSNCSEHTNKSRTNNNLQPQPFSQQNAHIALYNGVPVQQMNSAMPSYVISQGPDVDSNAVILPNGQYYPQYYEGSVQPVPNIYYSQDYFPSHNNSSPSNAFSFS